MGFFSKQVDLEDVQEEVRHFLEILDEMHAILMQEERLTEEELKEVHLFDKKLDEIKKKKKDDFLSFKLSSQAKNIKVLHKVLEKLDSKIKEIEEQLSGPVSEWNIHDIEDELNDIKVEYEAEDVIIRTSEKDFVEEEKILEEQPEMLGEEVEEILKKLIEYGKKLEGIEAGVGALFKKL